ncbi:hypothetical protein BRADI_4g06270v3, partial [Brachypodium distachyon]
IIARITRTSDLDSLSLVSKRLHTIEACQRRALRVSCVLCPAREALASLCSRFPNLWKVEIDYSQWTSGNGKQLDNKGLLVISSRCHSLTDLTLSFCSCINDSGYLADCKKLMSIRLNSAPEITSSGLLAWLEYLGWHGSLEELVVTNCKGINQYDPLKFGPGWMKLQKFGFDTKKRFFDIPGVHDFHDHLCDAHNPSEYDFFCETLKNLRLARFETGTKVGLRFLLGKCKALERLSLEYVFGLNDKDITALSQSCRNLKSISLWLTPLHYDDDFRTAFTDNSLKALSLCCPMLQAIELTFSGCEPSWPSEIGFTQEGVLVLIQSCPIRVLVLNSANFFDDDGMKALSSAPFLETLELMHSQKITDAGMGFIACTPYLTSLTLRRLHNVTDVGLAELAHAQKLESLIIECCRSISQQAAQGVARSVHHSETLQPGFIEKMYF